MNSVVFYNNPAIENVMYNKSIQSRERFFYKTPIKHKCVSYSSAWKHLMHTLETSKELNF